MNNQNQNHDCSGFTCWLVRAGLVLIGIIAIYVIVTSYTRHTKLIIQSEDRAIEENSKWVDYLEAKFDESNAETRRIESQIQEFKEEIRPADVFAKVQELEAQLKVKPEDVLAEVKALRRMLEAEQTRSKQADKSQQEQINRLKDN